MRFLRFIVTACGLAVVVCVSAGAQPAAVADHNGVFHGLGEPQLVILDTDIGDDIDDAFALGLVLKSPEIKLLGITTAFGDTELRARLVERYLDAAGVAGVPVVAGVKTEAKNLFSQRVYAEHGPATTHGDGVGFLLAQIKAHPGQITLIAIGPLTNIEAAVRRDPATFAQLKRVVIMGGSIDRGYGQGAPEAEWNVLCDPAGLRALLASGVPVFMMPLDSTQIPLETAQREKIFAHGSPLTDQLTLLYHQWIAASGGKEQAPTLYDPVAVTYAIRPDLCPATAMHVDVDDKGLTRRGAGPPNANVCLKADEKGFLELLVGRLTAK